MMLMLMRVCVYGAFFLQSGRTALHWAISNGRDDVMNVLLANAADCEMCDEVQYCRTGANASAVALECWLKTS